MPMHTGVSSDAHPLRDLCPIQQHRSRTQSNRLVARISRGKQNQNFNRKGEKHIVFDPDLLRVVGSALELEPNESSASDDE
jgi:hypothetical protein